MIKIISEIRMDLGRGKVYSGLKYYFGLSGLEKTPLFL
jgi:hypothetical protein